LPTQLKEQDLNNSAVKGCIREGQRYYDLVTYRRDQVPVIGRKACLVWAKRENYALRYYASLGTCLETVKILQDREAPAHFQP
jgi:hypothetical protein